MVALVSESAFHSLATLECCPLFRFLCISGDPFLNLFDPVGTKADHAVFAHADGKQPNDLTCRMGLYAIRHG